MRTFKRKKLKMGVFVCVCVFYKFFVICKFYSYGALPQITNKEIFNLNLATLKRKKLQWKCLKIENIIF